MYTVIKEIENLCAAMNNYKEHLEDYPQFPVLTEELKGFAAEIKRIVAIEPVYPSSVVKRLLAEEHYPVLILCLKQAKDRLDTLSENNTAYEIVDELGDIATRVQEITASVQDMIDN